MWSGKCWAIFISFSFTSTNESSFPIDEKNIYGLSRVYHFYRADIILFHGQSHSRIGTTKLNHESPIKQNNNKQKNRKSKHTERSVINTAQYTPTIPISLFWCIFVYFVHKESVLVGLFESKAIFYTNIEWEGKGNDCTIDLHYCYNDGHSKQGIDGSTFYIIILDIYSIIIIVSRHVDVDKTSSVTCIDTENGSELIGVER